MSFRLIFGRVLSAACFAGMLSGCQKEGLSGGLREEPSTAGLAASLDADRWLPLPGSANEAGLARVQEATASASAVSGQDLPPIKVDYPLAGSVFPPEIVAPVVLWHEPSPEANHWLLEVSLPATEHRIHALSDGRRPDPVIDPDAVAENNAWQEDDYQATAKGWTPDRETWEIMKRYSTEEDLALTVWGVAPDGRIVSRGSTSFRTSADPVGAPIFYRDVPLMPAETKDGIVKPIAASAITSIKWRLRDISKPSAPAVMEHMPTCANCHSFSGDGGTLAMDMDGPDGDKGAHTLQNVEKRMVIEDDEVFSWNKFDPDPEVMSFGLFPRVSPDGRYVAATVKEAVFVQNYVDFRFLQTFYPTRGIIAIYDRKTRKMAALPGADDPQYVQTNPAWTPDGQSIVFLRAPAGDSYPSEERAKYANDPNETQIQYDLYRIPFNGGKGGKASPVPGASNNGKSNSFPAFSPDGKWLVYVQAENGLLMRPDSRLFILPAEGGEAREMNCNTRLMNSWHTWSPNSRWLAFASKSRRPFTQIFLTHVDEDGNDSPAILLPGSTADNRAANLPEFVNIPVDGIASIKSPAVEYRRHFDDGEDFLEAGRLDEARKSLETSIELKDDYTKSLLMMGFVLHSLGRPAEAIPYYRRALSLDAKLSEAHHQWGNALLSMGRPDDAVEQYAMATRIKPKHSLAHSNIGNILLGKGDVDEALDAFASAAEANPSRPQTYFYWATAFMRLGEYNSAKEKLERALELKPDYTEALELLGQALVRAGRHEEALRRLEDAVAQEPKRASLRRILAELLSRARRPEAALEHLRAASELAPGDHLVKTDMARTLEQLDRPAESVACFRKALELEAGYDPARNRLAWILATYPDPAVRDGKEAVRHAELACRNTRWGNPIFMSTLAAAHAEAGNFDAAVDVAKKALKLAEATGNAQLTDGIRDSLRLYEQGRPFVQSR